MFNLRGPELAIVLIVSLVAALVPIFIAYFRRTDNRRVVLVVALLTSWSCLGWIVAMVLAATGRPQPAGGGATPVGGGDG